jgi:hypothetical protein
MRIFVTGSTGFVGSAIVQELRIGAPQSLAEGARMCEGVIPTAFIHDFSQFQANAEIDRRAIEGIGTALTGSGRPFVVTSGTAALTPGRVGTEDDRGDPNSRAAPRLSSEETTLSLASRGVGGA